MRTTYSLHLAEWPTMAKHSLSMKKCHRLLKTLLFSHGYAYSISGSHGSLSSNMKLSYELHVGVWLQWNLRFLKLLINFLTNSKPFLMLCPSYRPVSAWRKPPPKPRAFNLIFVHFLSNCKFLPESDHLFVSKIRRVAGLSLTVQGHLRLLVHPWPGRPVRPLWAM